MKKYSNYLTHDIGARNDTKLERVMMKMGMAGIGLYWCLVEMLWQFDGYISMDYESIAFSLHCDPDDVKRLVTEFDLFRCDGERIWSESALERLKYRNQVSAKRSEAGKKGAEVANDRRKLAANTVLTNSNCPGQAEAINESSNKGNQSTKNTISIDEKDRERLIEIFFFRNVMNPIRETERFLDYYNAHGWQFGNGRPINNIQSAAKIWKTENGSSQRFDKEFLWWYQVVYASVDNPSMKPKLIHDLEYVNIKGKEIAVRYKNPETARFVADFVKEKHLEQGYDLYWRVSN